MMKKTKATIGAATLAALLVAGGVAISTSAQAETTTTPSNSTVEAVDANDTDNIPDEVDGGQEGASSETEADDASEGPENTQDDVNGVAVEEGPQN